MSETNDLIEETPERFLALSAMWIRRCLSEAVCEPGGRASPDFESAGILIFEFKSPELWEMNVFCLSTQSVFLYPRLYFCYSCLNRLKTLGMIQQPVGLSREEGRAVLGWIMEAVSSVSFKSKFTWENWGLDIQISPGLGVYRQIWRAYKSVLYLKPCLALQI